MTTPPVLEPDDKDWTWVLTRPCPDCGYDAATVARDEVSILTMDHVLTLTESLFGDDAAVRPEPGVWSPLEYACHVRDVCRVFDGRLQLMLDEDDPLFPNWDQDATAVESRYWEQLLGELGGELLAAANGISERFAGISGAQWERTGRRSNGSEFTVDTLARYFLHDLAHHAWDVTAAR